MELTIDKRKIELNTRHSFGLSFWDLVFWQNNPIQINNEKQIPDKLNDFIENELQRLYNLATPENFVLNCENNPDLDRYINSELKALKAKGDTQAYNVVVNSTQKQNYALRFGTKQYEEYKNLVEILKNSTYSKSFQCLILNETLNYTYRMDFSKNEPNLIVNSRKPHITITGMINLPTQVLDFIYQNAPNYTTFKKLYLDAQVNFNNAITYSNVNFENVDTFGKGFWIKVDGIETDSINYEQNVAKLKALTANTPWCTNTLAGSHLSEGDYYVFLDNTSKPHIAIKMKGNAIDEVRGIKNGNIQELEDDYRDVAINFLQNNVEIQNGREWLEREEWNNRLIQYKQKIKDGVFESKEIGVFIQDILKKDFGRHGGNSNLEDIESLLKEIKPQFAEYFNCSLDEICASDYKPQDEQTCPYKVILKNANLENSNINDLGNLKIILGNATFGNCPLTNLGELEIIGGNANFYNSEVSSLNNLYTIGGDVLFLRSKVVDLGELTYIGGDASFYDCELDNLGKITTIGGSADFRSSKISNLNDLEYIGCDVWFENSNITSLGKLTKIGRDAIFYNSDVVDLGNLKIIGDNAYFKRSKITSLKNLLSIGGSADFSNSLITDLGDLKSIGKNLDLRDSTITDLKNLVSIGTLFAPAGQIKNAENLKKLDTAYIQELYLDDTGETILKEREMQLQEFKQHILDTNLQIENN